MKTILTIIFFSFSFSFFGQNEAENDSMLIKKIKLFKTNYKEFEVIDNDVYAITKGDSLIRFNIMTNESNFILNKVTSISSDSNYIIGLDQENKVFKIENKNSIKIINSELFKGIKKQKYFRPYKILSFKSEYLIISQSGIIYRNKLHKNKNSISNFSVSKKRGIYKPDLSFIDSDNLLWLCFDRGEFGEDVVFFDLNSCKYFEIQKIYQKEPYYSESSLEYKMKMSKKHSDKIKLIDEQLYYKFPYNLPVYNPIKGIVQNNDGKYLITQSLMHSMTSSSIYFLTKKDNYTSHNFLKDLIEYREPFIEDIRENYIALEYVGNCTYNAFNNSFYYYSDKGFFKIIESKSKTEKELLFKPNLKWKFGLPNSMGYQMNIIKFEFISENEMIFLTSNNGIGYFNGTNVKYFQ